MTEKQRPGAGINVLTQLFAESNRGILFDLLIFLANVFLMHLLTANFIELASRANSGDTLAAFGVFLFCLGIFILPPLGAILKRPHFHKRRKLINKDAGEVDNVALGCLFNPVMFFCLNIVIMAALNAFILQAVYGGKDPGGNVFVPMVFSGLIFTIVQTWLVYRYFTPPKREPKTAFFRSHTSELLADLFIFLNMILFQVMWNIFGMIEMGPITDVTDFLGRLFLLSFIALLIYFPPRIFFLAEDIRRPITWLTILLANSPVIFRMLFGGPGTHLQIM